MGVFNFIETFFFISLAITFVLILLLVYHFKQRISVLEQKHDTMFDIVNNVVKQLQIMRANVVQNNAPQFSSIPYLGENVVFENNQYNLPRLTTPMYRQQGVPIDDSVDNDESGDESGSESGDDESGDDESGDSGDDESGESGDDESVGQNDESEPLVKVINLEIGEMNYTNIPSDQEYLEEIEPIVEELQPIELSQSSEDPIIVHKIAEEMTNNVENSADDTKENSKYIYSKMNLQTLRTTVISKGLISDPSKMKKQELLKLLESADE